MSKYAAETNSGWVVIDDDVEPDYLRHIYLLDACPSDAWDLDQLEDNYEIIDFLGDAVESLLRGSTGWLPGHERSLEKVPGGIRLEVFVE